MLDSEANEEDAMVHVGVKIVVVFFQLLLQLSLHHSLARARVVAEAANDLVDVLFFFPIRLDLTAT